MTAQVRTDAAALTYRVIRDSLNRAFGTNYPQNTDYTGISIGQLSKDQIEKGILNLMEAKIISSAKDMIITSDNISFTQEFLGKVTKTVADAAQRLASADQNLSEKDKLVADVLNYTQRNFSESQGLRSHLSSAAQYKRYDNGEFTSKTGEKSTLKGLAEAMNQSLDRLEGVMNSVTNHEGINKQIDAAGSKLFAFRNTVETVTESLKNIVGEQYQNIYKVSAPDIIRGGVIIDVNPKADQAELKGALELLIQKANEKPQPEIDFKSRLPAATLAQIASIQSSGVSRGGNHSVGHDLYNAD